MGTSTSSYLRQQLTQQVRILMKALLTTWGTQVLASSSTIGSHWLHHLHLYCPYITPIQRRNKSKQCALDKRSVSILTSHIKATLAIIKSVIQVDIYSKHNKNKSKEHLVLSHCHHHLSSRTFFESLYRERSWREARFMIIKTLDMEVYIHRYVRGSLLAKWVRTPLFLMFTIDGTVPIIFS